jgi:DNA mismatch repair ATPase MutS
MTPLIKEYMEDVSQLREEFREDVVVVMMVGSFYEVYELEDPAIGHAKLASSILQIQLTKKNAKLGSSLENPWMCGFPIYTLGKFITRMNDEGYTVAVFDQKPENVKERYRRGVYSPAIRLEEMEDHQITDKQLCAVRIESYRSGLDRTRPLRFIFSMATTNMVTGEVGIAEFDTDDWMSGMGVAARYQPTEMSVRKMGDWPMDTSVVSGAVWKWADEEEEDDHVIHEAYEIAGKEDAAGFLGLERHKGVVEVLVTLFSYIRKHDPFVMRKLRRPEWLHASSMDYNRDAFMEFNIMDICHRRRSSEPSICAWRYLTESRAVGFVYAVAVIYV